MSTDTTVSPLRQRMIEDMAARKLGRHAQRSHVHSCRRFAAFLGRSPDTATADDVRRFQLHLVESGLSIPAPLTGVPESPMSSSAPANAGPDIGSVSIELRN